MTRRIVGKTIGDRKNSSRATRVFLYTSVGTIILYSIAASLPSIDRMLYDLTAFRLLETLGSGPNWGPGKLAILSVLLHLTIALNVAGFLLMIRRPGLASRFLILLVLGVMYVTHTGLLYYPTYHVRLVEGVKIENMPSIEYEDMFSKAHIPLSEIETEEDFFTYARAQFEIYRDFLREKWGISDDQKLEAVFYMNLVSHLWGYRNKIHEDMPGCTTMNERWKSVV